MAFADFQKLGDDASTGKLLECCHSPVWAKAVAKERVRALSLAELQDAGEKLWNNLGEAEQLEAFAAHPRIGDITSLRQKYANTHTTASGEQSGVTGAEEHVLHNLAHLNQQYERKHGFLFIVFATEKSAAEMLAILEARIGNPRPMEMKNAAAEQWKITKLRMEKLL